MHLRFIHSLHFNHVSPHRWQLFFRLIETQIDLKCCDRPHFPPTSLCRQIKHHFVIDWNRTQATYTAVTMVLHVRIAKEKVKFDLKSIFFCRNFSKGRKIRKKFAKQARNWERERERVREGSDTKPLNNSLIKSQCLFIKCSWSFKISMELVFSNWLEFISHWLIVTYANGSKASLIQEIFLSNSSSFAGIISRWHWALGTHRASRTMTSFRCRQKSQRGPRPSTWPSTRAKRASSWAGTL